MLRPDTLKSMLNNGDIVVIAPNHFNAVHTKCSSIISNIDSFLEIANRDNPLNSMRYPRVSSKIHALKTNYSAMRDDTVKLQAWAESAFASKRTSISVEEFVKFYELVVVNALLAERLKNENISQDIGSITTTVIVSITEKEILSLYESIRNEHLFVVINENTENHLERI